MYARLLIIIKKTVDLILSNDWQINKAFLMRSVLKKGAMVLPLCYKRYGLTTADQHVLIFFKYKL
jgi:hypothetical protein